ncbi:sterol desaturase family protein [Acuticoccus kandeliae]|uniref:sterol desaturase family protein n=1 Tax=Acuticoccus kandeliae TaxID=2073160 RepID=UPI000D3E0AD2|nr:sterol desaturase family protein [Acuticoccus kandeliae]
MTAIVEFLALWAAVYVVTFGLYIGFGALLQWFIHKSPERRIQKGRYGEKRKWKEIRQSAKSLTATCFCLAAGLFMQYKGWVLFPPLELSWWSVPLMFIVSIFAFDTWFYWAHRAMHWGPLYKFHAFHHRSVAPTVWSNYSDDLVDAFVMQSYYLWAPLILPIPAVVLIAHRLYDHFNGMIGHCGFEFAASDLTRIPSPMVCTLFHDQHHSKFKTNFANFFSFWDRAMGTIDKEYDTGVAHWTAANSRKATKADAGEDGTQAAAT